MKKIIAAIDFDEESKDILDHSAEIATALGAKIDLVHVFDPNPMIVTSPYLYTGATSESLESHQESMRAQKEKLHEMIDSLREKGIDAHGQMQPAGRDFAGTILNFAEEHDSELIIVGTHRPGRLERIILGSVSGELVRRSTTPVLVVPRTKIESE